MDNSQTQTTGNYIWQTDSRSELGSGATGTVYRALHKRTGRKVAAKVIKRDLKPLFVEYTIKEVELLKGLQHPNIVNFIADEEVKSSSEEYERGRTGPRAIILELCEGGTVQKLLQNAPNRFGLPDEIVLGVLRDMCEALKFLESKRIIHRDFKSDNILIAHSDTGDNIYKLTDFGGAYQSPDSHGPVEFQSVFGTVELMYPDMLEKGIINKNIQVNFDVGVDLWSFGVVLFQICTGKFPFVPYRGRADKSTLFRLISQKSPGDISGSDDESGHIEWKSELPDTCQISKSFKTSFITSIIAKLLVKEGQAEKRREELFKSVHNFPSLRIYIYNADEASQDIVYVQPSASLEQFQMAAERTTGIRVADQFICIGLGPLEHISLRRSSIESIVKTYNISELNPVVLMSNVITDVTPQTVSTTLYRQDYPEVESCDASLGGVEVWKWARQCISVGYLCDRHIKSLGFVVQLDIQLVHTLDNITGEGIQQLELRTNHLSCLKELMAGLSPIKPPKNGEDHSGQHGNDRGQHLKSEVKHLCHDTESLKVKQLKLSEVFALDASVREKQTEVERRSRQAKHLLNLVEVSTGYLREQRNQRLSHNQRQRRTLEVKLIHRQTLEVESIFKWIRKEVDRTHNHVMKYVNKYKKVRDATKLLLDKCDRIHTTLNRTLGIGFVPSVPSVGVANNDRKYLLPPGHNNTSEGQHDNLQNVAGGTDDTWAMWTGAFTSDLDLSRVGPGTSIQATDSGAHFIQPS